MQVSSDLKCPWCLYKFSEDIKHKLLPNVFTEIPCPRCTNTFRVTKIKNGTLITSADCQENGIRHNWKYCRVTGYDLWKKCRRCGKEDARPAQLKLPGMQATTT